jgi:hypothetical protein
MNVVWYRDMVGQQEELGRLETVQNDFIRWITGHTRKDRVSIKKLKKAVGMASIEENLCCRRLHLFKSNLKESKTNLKECKSNLK